VAHGEGDDVVVALEPAVALFSVMTKDFPTLLPSPSRGFPGGFSDAEGPDS
jgi:hypothetical protein